MKRIIHFFRSLLGLAVTNLEKSNPEALLESEKESLRKQVLQYNQGLAAHAAMVEKLIAQLKRQESQETALIAKIKANVQAGNTDFAGREALKLKELRNEIDVNREQLEAAETTYQQMTRSRESAVKEAQKRIQTLQSKINELRVSEATAELSEMATGLTTELGGANETLSRLESIVEDSRAKAAGRVRVARDAMPTLDMPTVDEEKALGNEALRDLAGELGFATAVENKGQEELPLIILNADESRVTSVV